MIIDSHLHLWVNDPENYPWSPIGGYVPEKEAPLAEFLTIMENNGVEGAVLVQPTPYGWDNAYLLHCKQQFAQQLKAVVLVDPFSEDAAGKFSSLYDQGADGLRVNLHLEPLSSWSHPKFYDLIAQCALHGCPVCFQTTPEYFSLIEALSDQFPIPFIIDHLGRPEPGCRIGHPHFQRLLSLSTHANIFIKLSGMNYFSEQSAPFADTWDLLRAVNECFGADHCLWGSDYPFVNEHWSYAENIASLHDSLGWSDADLDWILGRTAGSLWWPD